MYYLFKVERCDAINLLSKHATFEDALAAMKESLVKKIKETKGLSITAGDLTPENADKYSFEFDADPSFPFDDEKGPVVTATNYSDDGITEWGVFNVATDGQFVLFKNVEDRYMNVLDTYDDYDDAYEAMKEDVAKEVNDTFGEELFDAYNVDDEDGEAEDYNVTVISVLIVPIAWRVTPMMVSILRLLWITTLRAGEFLPLKRSTRTSSKKSAQSMSLRAMS